MVVAAKLQFLKLVTVTAMRLVLGQVRHMDATPFTLATSYTTPHLQLPLLPGLLI